MPPPDDEPMDEQALLHCWMRHLCSSDQAAAEACADEALRRYRRREGPAWLRQRDALLRLQYCAIKVVLEYRAAA